MLINKEPIITSAGQKDPLDPQVGQDQMQGKMDRDQEEPLNGTPPKKPRNSSPCTQQEKIYEPNENQIVPVIQEEMQIQTKVEHKDNQSLISNEVDQTFDNFDVAVETNQKTLKAKPWVEIPELAKIAKCQHNSSLLLRLQRDFKQSLLEHQKDTWFKNYKSLVRKLSEFLNANHKKSIVELLYDFAGNHASQLTKAKAVAGKFADAYNLKINKDMMKSKFKTQIREFKANREELHQFWSGSELQQIYDAFYCCHPYTRLFFYFALTTGCRGEDMFKIKFKDFQDSLEDDEQSRRPLKLIDGKVLHLKWDRLVWWPERVREQMKKDSALLGNRTFLFGPKNGHEKLRDKVLRLLQKHILPEHPEVEKLYLSRFHSFRTTAYNLLSQSINESKKLSEKVVNQYFGWESQGVQKKYTRSLQDKTLKKIANEIEVEFPWPNTTIEKDQEYITKLHDNINSYVKKYMI